MNVGSAIANAEELAASVQAELDAFQQFVQVLQTEQEALIQGDIDRLIDLTRIKSEKVVLLSQLAAKRARFLASQGFAAEQGGMEKWLTRHDADGPRKISPTWGSLIEQATRAQHLNQTNGVMIETRLRHNQQALTVLQAAALQQSSIYGPDGQTHVSGMGRALGKV